MSGFETLCEITAYNEQARDAEYGNLADMLDARREGLDVETWRALPDTD